MGGDSRKGIEEKRKEIIEDFYLGIHYQPEVEVDAISLMQQYIKERKRRKELGVWIIACLEGKPYPNPYQSWYPYDTAWVAQLEEWMKGLEGCEEEDTLCWLQEVWKGWNLAQVEGVWDTYRLDLWKQYIEQVADNQGWEPAFFVSYFSLEE